MLVSTQVYAFGTLATPETQVLRTKSCRPKRFGALLAVLSRSSSAGVCCCLQSLGSARLAEPKLRKTFPKAKGPSVWTRARVALPCGLISGAKSEALSMRQRKTSC